MLGLSKGWVAFVAVLVVIAIAAGAYQTGYEHAETQAEADKAAAIAAALERRERLEALGRGVTRIRHEREAEQATRVAEARREVTNDVAADDDDPVCLDADGVLDFNQTLRRIAGLPRD